MSHRQPHDERDEKIEKHIVKPNVCGFVDNGFQLNSALTHITREHIHLNFSRVECLGPAYEKKKYSVLL
ncbi:MAG: hypothetical protein MUP85_14345 [Candidatus Lokiarchaeota archaeon]|nr:hypothetical protein [Candidatus Lokiarchaeota archaeon]